MRIQLRQVSCLTVKKDWFIHVPLCDSTFRVKPQGKTNRCIAVRFLKTIATIPSKKTWHAWGSCCMPVLRMKRHVKNSLLSDCVLKLLCCQRIACSVDNSFRKPNLKRVNGHKIAKVNPNRSSRNWYVPLLLDIMHLADSMELVAALLKPSHAWDAQLNAQVKTWSLTFPQGKKQRKIMWEENCKLEIKSGYIVNLESGCASLWIPFLSLDELIHSQKVSETCSGSVLVTKQLLVWAGWWT